MKKLYFFVSKYIYNVYQPIICLKSQTIFAFEILTRMKYKNREYTDHTAYEIFSQSSDTRKNR